MVTGAAGAIGSAVAARYAEAGYVVHGWDLTPGTDDRVRWSRLSLTDWPAMRDAAAASGEIDVVVNLAAAGGGREAALDTPPEAWAAAIDLTLNGSFYLARAVFPGLAAAGGGTLVNIASVAASSGFRDRAPYCTGKAGLLALTRCLAIEWAEHGVRVLAVSPGFSDTPGMHRGIAEGRSNLDAILAHTPQRRLITVEELAAAVYRLSQPEFRALTGSEVLLDGGFVALGGI